MDACRGTILASGLECPASTCGACRLDQDDTISRQLQQELKDQQEAMDALMDMLEKTITVEVKYLWNPFRCRIDTDL
jgi:hypothetical protein